MCHHRRIPKQLISLVVASAILLSSAWTAAAIELDEPEGLPAAAVEAGPENQPAETGSLTASEDGPQNLTEDAGLAESEGSAEPVEPDGQPGIVDESIWSGTPVVTDPYGMAAAAEVQYTAPTQYVQNVSLPESYTDVYDRMIALKAIYPEGLPWTNYVPYGNNGSLGDAYWWQGGSIKGASGGMGCAAFAFILSDAAFGSLPATVKDSGAFTFDDVRPGDLLRVNGNSHFVIVLQKTAAGVTVAEANYNSSVHWGRAMSQSEVMAADFLVTRYPANFTPSDAPGAGEEADSGMEGSLSWTLTNAGVLTISGSGAIPNYSSGDDAPWNGLTVNTIIIEKGVTSIGDFAFYQSPAIAVYIPDSVTSIGQSAFYGSSLLAVTIPSSVKTIGNSAFRNCSNITSATISDGVTTIGENAFRDCTALAYIDFPSSVTSVGSAAFMECSKMTRVRFMPGSTTVAVGDNLFTSCGQLTEVTLPLMINKIGAGMFESCKLLTRIYIPASVTQVGPEAGSMDSGSPFAETGLKLDGIYFGGSETTWNSICSIYTRAALEGEGITVYFNAEFEDPFAKDPNDPGDLPGSSVGSGHTHNWSAAWTYNGTGHWHECGAAGCPVTSDSQKDGYAAHSFGSWVTDVGATASQNGSRHRDCTVCGYRQTESIPSTGGSSSGSGSSGGSSSSSSSRGSSGTSSTTTTTMRGPDGSTITTATNYRTGVKTVTVRYPDGSSTVTTTQKDGTVSTVTADAAGKAETDVTLPSAVINTARQRGEAVLLPIAEVRVVRDISAAAAITVHTEQGETVKAAVPTAWPTAGTVAVLINPDGSSEVLRESVTTNGSVVVSLPDGATVKIVDNRKSFSDVPSGLWAEDAIAFVTARELFAGTAEDTFSPNNPMTRAMLMTVLARFDGAETAGGATAYTKGIEWAIAHGISDGTNPDGSITREQLISMLWRYMGSPAAVDSLPGYTDIGQISGYAQEAMRWAVNNGIINGFADGRLDPGGSASRAQVAQILMNLINA